MRKYILVGDIQRSLISPVEVKSKNGARPDRGGVELIHHNLFPHTKSDLLGQSSPLHCTILAKNVIALSMDTQVAPGYR
jgi:hypothetical protein